MFKYLLEGIVVATAAFLVGKNRLSIKDVVTLGIVALVISYTLDTPIASEMLGGGGDQDLADNEGDTEAQADASDLRADYNEHVQGYNAFDEFTTYPWEDNEQQYGGNTATPSAAAPASRNNARIKGEIANIDRNISNLQKRKADLISKTLPKQRKTINPTEIELLDGGKVEVSSIPMVNLDWNADVQAFVEVAPANFEVTINGTTYIMDTDRKLQIPGQEPRTVGISDTKCTKGQDYLRLVDDVPVIVHFLGQLWLTPSVELRNCVRSYFKTSTVLDRIGALDNPMIVLK
jgi:hypothetical protein